MNFNYFHAYIHPMNTQTQAGLYLYNYPSEKFCVQAKQNFHKEHSQLFI